VHNWNDIGTDILNTVGLNRFSARNNNAANAAKAAQSQYSNLTLTGHSLGGAEAMYAAKSMKTPPAQTVVFAPHVNYFQNLTNTVATKFHDFFFKPKERQPSNTYIYKTQTDPVTAYISPHYLNAHISTVREVDPLNPHSMDNFINPG
jgi:alpha-beta hydrolase superfamily lysophospholipase